MRPQRILLRSLWLALPASVALLGLVLSVDLAWPPALVAWLVALLLSLALSWLRERRLEATSGYLEALAEGRAAASPPEFGPLGSEEELATALHRLDRALAEQRERRAETDRLLATLLDALPDPLLLVGREGAVVGANKAAAALFGQAPVGRPIEACLRDPGLLAAVEEALEDHGEAQLTIRLPGPPSRAFGVMVVPVRLRRQAAALIGLRELTEQLMIERMRSDFVANASHELRTPLTALRGFIDTLAGPAKDDPAARERFLETMAGEAARMSRLVDDLLSLSRIEQTEHQPPAERVDLGECLRGVVQALRPYAEERRTPLEVVVADDLPLMPADRDQLVQLLTNLVDNAIKYGGGAGPVTIRADHVAAAPPGAGPLTGRAAVRVVISDHGPGIAPEHLPRVTERFFRVDPGRSRQLGGTGLGLAIVKHIIRRHRGHLLIESELGQGTSATVYLPAR